MLVGAAVLRRSSIAAVAFAALALSGCASSAPSASPVDRDVSTSSSTPAGAVSAPVSARQPRRIHRLGPLQTVEHDWRDINAGKYGAAFRYLKPGSIPQGRAQFVSDEQQAGIEKVDFSGQLSARTAASATVAVTSLTTQDAQFGCRDWTGSYQLSKDGAHWLIDRASIAPSSARLGSLNCLRRARRAPLRRGRPLRSRSKVPVPQATRPTSSSAPAMRASRIFRTGMDTSCNALTANGATPADSPGRAAYHGGEQCSAGTTRPRVTGLGRCFRRLAGCFVGDLTKRNQSRGQSQDC